jgi:hypothetical protein
MNGQFLTDDKGYSSSLRGSEEPTTPHCKTPVLRKTSDFVSERERERERAELTGGWRKIHNQELRKLDLQISSG